MPRPDLNTKLVPEAIGNLVNKAKTTGDEDSYRKLKKIYDATTGNDFCICNGRKAKFLINYFEEWLLVPST